MALAIVMKPYGIRSHHKDNVTLRYLPSKPPGLKPSTPQSAAQILPKVSSAGVLCQTHSCDRRPSVSTSAQGGSDGNAPPADPAPIESPPASPAKTDLDGFIVRPAWITLMGATALTVIASDIFLSGSPHMLAPVDTAMATWVETNMPVTEDSRLLAKLLSNLPITLAMVGICVTGLASGLQRPRASLQRLSAAFVILTAPGWTITSKDFPVVDVLKHIFKRNRPAFGLEHSSTFSFPSGHTFVCLFLLGIIAIMAHTPDKPAFDVKPAAAVTAAIRRNTTPLMCLAAVTATGRVLSDVHWVSDTMAGAAAATTMLGLTLLLLEALDNSKDS